MELTEAELKEGRRLLNNSQHVMQDLDSSLEVCVLANQAAQEWLWGHADALLADREDIAREAVRDFAETILVQFDKRASIWERGAEELGGDAAKRCKARAEVMRGDAMNGVRHLAAARGVTLGKKP